MQAALFDKARMGPFLHVERTSLEAPARRDQARRPLADEAVDLLELVRRITRSEVVAPTTQERVEIRNHLSDIAPPHLVQHVEVDVGEQGRDHTAVGSPRRALLPHLAL